MSQADFASLAIRTELADESFDTKATDASDIAVGKQHDVQTYAENGKKTASEVYVPVNYIPDEVLIFIEAWESANWSSKSPCDSMVLDEVSISVSQDMFEPTRSVKVIAPPKRFYRTFWRSITRRIIALSSK
jgi:hypothetical protein